MVDENGNGVPNGNGNGNGSPFPKGASPITGVAPPLEHRFKHGNGGRNREDLLTRCLKDVLRSKEGKEGRPKDDIRQMGKYPPRMLAICQAAATAAADPDCKGFSAAQRTV